jgi:hypothetical protein
MVIGFRHFLNPDDFGLAPGFTDVFIGAGNAGVRMDRFDEARHRFVAGFQLYALIALVTGFSILVIALIKAIIDAVVGPTSEAAWGFVLIGLCCYVLGSCREGVIMVIRQRAPESEVG